jgi:hypothetical protein
MYRRIIGASAAALTCLAMAGVAQAEPTSFSGTVANGGCDSARTVVVNGPSRIDATVSSTASERGAYVEILRPGGSHAAIGSYDTPSGGAYSLRVCTFYDSQNTPSMQYTVLYATGPAGHAALPQQQGQVLGVTATISHAVKGTGAIRTHAGLAYFTIKYGGNGLATLSVLNPFTHTHMLFTRAHVSFGKNVVHLRRGTMRLTLLQSDTSISTKLTFRSAKFSASGWVVKGNFIIL